MQNLLEGRRVSKKRYDYSHHCRADVPGEYLEPHDVIIVEGIHAFYDARLRAMMDLKLYMHVESDICLLRRIQRDINERGRQIDNISSQYITTVKPMFDQYIRNYEHTPTSSSPAAARTPRSRKSSPDISTTICTSIAA